MHHSNAVRRILPNGCVCVGWCVCVCRWVGGSVPNDSVSCSPSPFAGRCGVCMDVCLQELRAAQPRLKWGFPCVPDGMRVPIAMPMPLELRTDAGAAEKGILFAYHYGRCTCVCLCMFVCGCVCVCVEVWGSSFPRHQIETLDKSVWQIHKSIRLKFCASGERGNVISVVQLGDYCTWKLYWLLNDILRFMQYSVKWLNSAFKFVN